MKRKEIAKKLGITILASMLAFPCMTPAICLADTKESVVTSAVKDEISDTSSDQEAEDGKEQNSSQESKELNLTLKTYEKEYKTEEGRIYKKISFEYPVADGSSKAARTLNQFYQKLLKKWKKSAVENLDEAKEMIQQTDSADSYYADEVACKITSQDENYISVMQSGYDYSMGAHGMPYRYTYVFDAKTGKKVSAATLLGMSKTQVNEKVRSLYLKKFDQAKKEDNLMFYPDRNDVKTTLNKMDFNDNKYYLKNGKLRFYADPYAVAPYAGGFIEVAVKLS